LSRRWPPIQNGILNRQGAKKEQSFTAEDAEDAEEEKSFTAKGAKKRHNKFKPKTAKTTPRTVKAIDSELAQSVVVAT